MLFKSDVPRSARKLVTKGVSQASFFKIHASNFPIHEEKETGSLRLKGRVVGSKVNRKVKASEIYIYIYIY